MIASRSFHQSGGSEAMYSLKIIAISSCVIGAVALMILVWALASISSQISRIEEEMESVERRIKKQKGASK